MRSNLALYKALAVEALKQEAGEAHILACELDRNPLREYGGSVSFDSVPALRTGGPKVFIVSLCDLSSGWEKQKFHRFLAVEERFSLQGHDPKLKGHFKTNTGAMKATGNAFNVVQVACMVAPLLESAARSGVLRKEGVRKLSPQELGALVPVGGPPECPTLQNLCETEETQVKKRKRMKC